MRLIEIMQNITFRVNIEGNEYRIGRKITAQEDRIFKISSRLTLFATY